MLLFTAYGALGGAPPCINSNSLFRGFSVGAHSRAVSRFSVVLLKKAIRLTLQKLSRLLTEGIFHAIELIVEFRNHFYRVGLL